ncbi:MAG: hypothetical protein R2856_15530 [Caldilineaceae bacterium]
MFSAHQIEDLPRTVASTAAARIVLLLRALSWRITEDLPPPRT